MHLGKCGRYKPAMFHDLFLGKKVFLTGHTGFKGCWLATWLVSLGAKVCGYALSPEPHELLYRQLDLKSRLDQEVFGDIRDPQRLKAAMVSFEPDYVFHLAAQPLVRASYVKPRETFEINVMGTVNVLESLVGSSKPCSVVVVTTDKCYENKEWLHAYREEDPLGGYDPYSASKGCAELVTSAYRRSFFNPEKSQVRISSARAGNVIGGGDWALDRIVPDVMRSVFANEPVAVRNKRSTRPWQHVLEPLSGYLALAAHLSQPKLTEYSESLLASAFNFGPELEGNRSVVELVEQLLVHTGGSWIDASMPNEPHEASKLNLSIDKAYHILGWKPTWSFARSVEQTALWYRNVQDGMDSVLATRQCLERYLQDAKQMAQSWALDRRASER